MSHNPGLMKILRHLGPITIENYINLALYQQEFGYYAKNVNFGRDFVTSPMLSSLFGQTIALYLLKEIKGNLGIKSIYLIEFGAGNGKLIKDIAEACISAGEKNFIKKITICERSEMLIQEQKNLLKNLPFKVTWQKDFHFIDYSSDFNVIIGNEFLDSLAIKQYIYTENSFHEIGVKIEGEELRQFYFKRNDQEIVFDYLLKFGIKIENLKEKSIIEMPREGLLFFKDIGNLLKRGKGGSLLFIDYGEHEYKIGSSLQAIHNNVKGNYLDNMGYSDITHLVMFPIFIAYMKNFGIKDIYLLRQRDFLFNNHINELYAQMLANNDNENYTKSLKASFQRLTGEEQMGKLFKVLGGHLLI